MKILLALAVLAMTSCSSLQETVPNCKVLELQQYQTLETVSGKTQSRMNYKVITDNGQFSFEPSLDGTHDFFLLKKDSTYTFLVGGFKIWGRNILKIVNK